MFSFLLVAAAVFPLLSFALPSSHSHSLHHRAPRPPRIMSYYPDWAPPEHIDYSLFDVVIFAFALPDQHFQLSWDNDQAPVMLTNLVSVAHAASAKISLSIGGWTGSRPVPSPLTNLTPHTSTRYFSDAVATPQGRDTFANNILDAYKRFNLDGIDIDWEYPGQIGQQGNSESATDSANMLQFFKVLQQKLPPGAMISAAVQDTTFTGPDGQPMKDVSPFSQVVDWITLMNYDTYESMLIPALALHSPPLSPSPPLFLVRQPPGPNAPLSDGCGNSSQPSQNAVGGYNAWTSAGFPPSKIVLGVPAYGYIVESNARRLSTRSPSRAYSEDGSGQIQFQSLINQGILTQSSDGSFIGSSGFTREWDECSATPYLHSTSAGQVIPYDDTESLGIKAAWVKKMNMGGVNLFDIHGDTPKHDLTNALRTNLFPSPTQSTAMPSSSTSILSPNTIRPSSSTPALLSTTLPDGIVLFPYGS
ncbi:glycoside hydrolase family 18 protein [Butyriboletus roseoflavus]|nr:glycoside hydrolase family 18 protein [Butyriboletus roseoflavus]